jgi:hypothetical protein
MNKLIFVAQPYWVGNREGKSLAVIIPSPIVKESKIDPTTIFRIHSNIDQLILERIPSIDKKLESVDVMEPNQQTNSKI